MKNQNPNPLTPPQAAELIGVSSRTMQRYIDEEKIKATEINPQCQVIERDDFRNFVIETLKSLNEKEQKLISAISESIIEEGIFQKRVDTQMRTQEEAEKDKENHKGLYKIRKTSLLLKKLLTDYQKRIKQ